MLILAGCALLFAQSQSQTPISGNIYDGSGGPLTLANSPYLVPAYATLSIPDSQALTIEPGVIVRLKEMATVEIYGTLTAEGDSANRIRFISDTVTERWYTFIFRQESNSSLKFCDIEHGGSAPFGQGQQLLLQNAASLIIDNCTIHEGEDEGISGMMGSGVAGALSITNSAITNNGGNGIEVSTDISSPVTLTNNTILNNGGSAFRLGTDIYPSGGTVSGNGFDGIETDGGITSATGIYEFNLLVNDFKTFNIGGGTTVTLIPGTEVRMKESATFDISGTLIAEGTGADRITFTSHTPPQLWFTMIFRSGSTGSFKYCDIRQGGRLGYEQIVLQDPASITIDQCNIIQGGGDGIGGIVGSGQTGVISVTNSTLGNNMGNGADLSIGLSGTATLDGNTFTANTGSAYRLNPNNYPTNSTISGNGFDGIELTGGNVTVSGAYEPDLLIPDLSTVNISSGVTVTLMPGVEVRMSDGATLDISGTLVAEGTLNNRNRITRHLPGTSWNSLIFRSGSSGSFKFCDIDFGGKYGFAQLNLQDPLNILIEECIIANGSGSGVDALVGSGFAVTLNINNCIFTNNALDAIRISDYGLGAVSVQCNIISDNGGDGIRISRGDVSLQYNYISSNTGNGLTNAGPDTVDATGNWWGDSNGPSGLGAGSGDEVANTGVGSVNFSSWATIPAFAQCGDSIATGTPFITSLFNGDTLLAGSIETFVIYGGNFDTAVAVTLTRGTRGAPDPGPIQGTIKTMTSSLIIADFDLTNYDIIADWDLVVQNPDSSSATDTVFFIPSLVFIGAELTGTVGYPVVPFGAERSNYLQIFNFGNNEGVILLEITPPSSEYINLKIESKTDPAYDRSAEPDKTKAYVLLPLAEKQWKTLSLFWAVDPGHVVYPPAYGALKTSGTGKREGEDELVFGSDKMCTYKGLQGATKAQVKGLLIGSMVTAGCGALTDALLGDPELTNLKKAVDNVVDGLPNGISKTPKWVAEQVANELINLIPGVGWAQIIGGCLNQILGGFFNAWHSAAKGAADRLRASTNGTQQAAFERAMDQVEKNGKLNWYSAQALYQVDAALQQPPCNPPAGFNYSTIGPIRGPFDPNDKTTTGNFINGLETNGDTVMVHMIPSSALADTIRYTIFFENKAQATDSAISVTITDTLDALLDPGTLQIDSSLSVFSRGNFSWSLNGNILTIEYDSILLPPNVAAPEGEWQASYTVKLLPGPAAGTRIKNRAKIVFDFNPPIFTPEVIHIIGSPEIAATSTSIDFGTLTVGSVTTEQVWLKNTGAYDLLIGANSLLTSSFEVATDQCSSGILQPGDSCGMVIRFIPSFTGALADTLEIESSDISRFPFRIALKGDAVTGIGEAAGSSIRIFPNPATGELNVVFGKSQRYNLRITDFIGAEIFKTTVTGYSAKIDVKNFLPGVYFILVTDESGRRANKKFIKM